MCDSLKQIFDDIGIEYRTNGANVGKNELNIACPWCGDDPSYHLGISLQTGYYHCWRNPTHSGRNLARVIARVCRIGLCEARALLQQYDVLPSHDDVSLNTSTSPATAETRHRVDVNPLYGTVDIFCAPRMYIEYLHARRYTMCEVERANMWYGIRAGIVGPLAGRVVFPVTIPDGCVVGAQGRAVVSNMLRYRMYPGASAKTGFVGATRLVRGGNTLFVVEGPFDALRVITLCHNDDFCVPVLGLHMTESQQRILRTCAPRWKRIVVIPDNDAWSAAFALANQLADIDVGIRFLPQQIHDPDELDASMWQAMQSEMRE